MNNPLRNTSGSKIRNRMASLVTALLVLLQMAGSPFGRAEEAELPPVIETDRKEVKLPGLAINLTERCVDVESAVCLREGALELVACTVDSKEHEAIVTIGATAMHVHTALLLLGAESGHPAMRKFVDEVEGRWVDLPPRGGAVDVFLVLAKKEGGTVERPISDFIVATGEPDEGGKRKKFPTNTFLFAGSHLQGEGEGPRRYLADQTGNVISLVTFGDELLCLPDVHGQENGSLQWEVDGSQLPAVGSKVTLRLRPKLKPAAKEGTRKGE